MDSVIEKLQKMLNHERSARSIGNTHEAEAFAAKIAGMLFTHKLSMSEVEIAAEERDEPVAQENVEGLKASWAGSIAMGVCSASFCKVLKSSNGFFFIGRPNDRQTAISTFRYLCVMGKNIATDELAAYKLTSDYEYQSSFNSGISRRWENSFMHGYADALYKRLAAERKVLTAQAEAAGTSLVYINKSEAAIAEFVEATYGKLGKGRASTSRVHGGAYGAGQVAGQRVSIKSQGALN